MQRTGAPPQALAFMDAEGGMLYANDFQDTSGVGVASIVCTMPTNFNCGYSFLIVNSTPDHLPVGVRGAPELVSRLGNS